MNNNRKLGLKIFAIPVLMLGLAYASVPLYDLFCRVTGFGGTTQQAIAVPEQATTVPLAIRFNADVSPELPWDFAAEKVTASVKVGEAGHMVFKATNRSNKALVGTATYNVTPHKAGPYFSKVQCFCFERQEIQPGETIEFPVTYFVDEAMLQDPETADIREIVLSYTFFLAKDQTTPLHAANNSTQQERQP